jgi:hypothetical protein
MAYEYTNDRGVTYFLHSKDVVLRGNYEQTIYYFAREAKEGAIDALPEGREVIVNKRTGLPLLRKIRKDEDKAK